MSGRPQSVERIVAGSARTPVLIGDMGGTNARFALTVAGADGEPDIAAVREFALAQFTSIEQAARHYLAEVGARETREAVLAVASVVNGDHIRITNHPWTFSIESLERELGFAGIEVINDFAAIGIAIPHLKPQELEPVGPLSAPVKADVWDGRFAILGPGTGLGVGGLLVRGGEQIVIASEGGHIGFAPNDAYELAILGLLMKKFGRVSTERLVSGAGLLNLYLAVCAIEGTAAMIDSPAAITEHAIATPDGVCARTVEVFCAILGSFAGDIVLALGAWDGVYLAGGVTSKMLPWLGSGLFRTRFEAKGRFESLLKQIPTVAITHRHIGLLGAAVRAGRTRKS